MPGEMIARAATVRTVEIAEAAEEGVPAVAAEVGAEAAGAEAVGVEADAGVAVREAAVAGATDSASRLSR